MFPNLGFELRGSPGRVEDNIRINPWETLCSNPSFRRCEPWVWKLHVQLNLGLELQFPTRGSNIGIGTQSSLGFDSGSEFKHRVSQTKNTCSHKVSISNCACSHGKLRFHLTSPLIWAIYCHLSHLGMPSIQNFKTIVSLSHQSLHNRF